MIKIFAQDIEQDNEGNLRIAYDWYNGILPRNMIAEEQVYFDTSYSYTSFYSEMAEALSFGFASGNYGRSNIVTGKNGIIRVGKFTILEATNLISNKEISIGDHCMFSWGSVITDSWITPAILPVEARRKLLDAAARINRHIEFEQQRPVVIEDNVWVGFDSVVMPGVRLGRGCVVGCKTIIDEDVPPYAIIAGNPPRIIKYLDPTDTEEQRRTALETHLKEFA